ncbi:uncharacterized protein LOC133197487 [Saccostrea echinata]|uniref:uncharacterized protein LOC133197487 n=1 Tax=Saccostrea echinata TaxID=191078 RepID=UPI002A7F5CD3|nr:uncharacterized protein LOC133197487 [Saccostrea echinata]
METESTEIDFRSLEDELYDNEITQILTQPNTTEKSTLNTPELPADVDRLVDHLSVELKHAAEKLFEVDPLGSSERDASSDEEGSSKCSKTRDKFLSLEDLEEDKEDSFNYNDDHSDTLDKENSIRMGQLSVELKEAAEKLFAVDPLGSSEKDVSSSDQEMSCSDSDVESDGESDPFSLNNDDHSQSKSENSDDSDDESEAEAVNSFSRSSSPNTVRSDLNSETNDFVSNCEKSSVMCHVAQLEAVNSNELSNFEDDKQEETQDSTQTMDVEIAEKVVKNSASPCSKNNVENHVENGDLDISSGTEFKLLITDVRSEHVDFHQREEDATEDCVGEPEHQPATEIDVAEPANNSQHSHNSAADSKHLSFSSSLINVEDNETSLVVENVFSLSDQQKENELDEFPQKQDENDVCENNITSRSLRARKVKNDVNKVNEPVHLKKKKSMKKSSKENVEKCLEGGPLKTEFDIGINNGKCKEDIPPLVSHDKDTKSIQVEDKEDCSQTPMKESEKMKAYTIQDGQYKCHFCSCTLTTKSRFKMHMLSLHNKRYTCRHCDKKFLKCQDLAIHVKTRHSNELKYKVSKSGQVHSFEKDDRSKHKVRRKRPATKCTLTLSKGKGQLTYACGYCGEVFEKQQTLACHIRNKHVLPNDSGKIVYKKSGKFGRNLKEKAKFKLKSKRRDRKNGSSVIYMPPVQDAQNGESSCASDNENQEEDSIEVPSKRPRRDTKASRAAESGLDRIAQLQKDYNIRISHQVFRCGYCPKWFFKKTDLSSHLQKHVDNQEKERESKFLENPEEERNAEKIGDWDSEMKKRDKHQNSRFFCKYCTSQFKSLYNLQVHIVRHLGEVYKDDMSENKLECAFCGYIFPSVNGSNIDRILRHLFDHYSPENEDIDPYDLLECRYCGVPFLSNEKLRPHENEHRKFLDAKRRKKTPRKSVEEKVNNEDQEEKGSESERLKNSEFIEEENPETIAADDPVPFTCGMCSSRFPSSQYLLHHMTLHMKGKYVFRVEVDKSKTTQESPIKRLVESPNRPVKSLMLKTSITEKKPNSTGDKQLSNKKQYISPLVQDRIQTMLRQSISFKHQEEEDNGSVSPKKTLRQITKPQILKKSTVPCDSPTKDNNYNRSISVQTEINSSPKMHNNTLTAQNSGKSHKLVSIITKQPTQIKSKDSQVLSFNPATPKKSDSEMGKNKRKQTFNVSDIKEDFEPKRTNSALQVSKTGKRKLSFTRDVETEGDIELPPVHCAEDLLDCSSTETADGDLSDSVNGETETLKTKPSVESKYKEVSSSESSPTSDSASDFERDWKSRYYNKKKKIGRKRRKKSARRRLSSAKLPPKRDHAKRENARGWKRKINFANGKWFECSLCLYKCTMEKDYLMHVKTHESIDQEERDLVECNICQRKFMSKWHLQNHRAQHRNNEYQCTYCGMDFATSSAIVTHINEVHESVV